MKNETKSMTLGESIFCIVGGLFAMNFYPTILWLLTDKWISTTEMISMLFEHTELAAASTLLVFRAIGVFCILVGLIGPFVETED